MLWKMVNRYVYMLFSQGRKTCENIGVILHPPPLLFSLHVFSRCFLVSLQSTLSSCEILDAIYDEWF